MKIGIYNRFWNTCGGGENYTGSVAEVLAQDHQVELICVEPVDWNRIQSRLRLDFSKCTFRQWPNESCSRLSPLTAQYDFFINSTYCSSISPRSRLSALICYFPHRVTLPEGVLARVALSVQVFLLKRRKNTTNRVRKEHGSTISPISGVFAVENDGRAWLGPEALLAVDDRTQSPYRIPLWPNDYNGLQSITVNGKEESWHLDGRYLCINLSAPRSGLSMIELRSKAMVPMANGSSADSRQLGACVDTRQIKWSLNLEVPSDAISEKSSIFALSSYNRIVSISNFTSEWVYRRWRLPSVKLQPPIDIAVFNTDLVHAKERIILSVGRFFAGSHNKKHHEIAEAFIRLRAEGHVPDDWRLILVGARHRELPMHLDYYDKLVSICGGHPIEIRPDVPFTELLDYYHRASIYWHAAGWGENIEDCPENFEHFGMTTCEAMACGCVPIVFSAAGQKEIVDSAEIGFHFSNYEDLAPQLAMLTRANPKKLQEIGRNAQESIFRFARSTFKERVRKAFRGLCY